MSIAVLVQVQEEVRRLAIAGSAVAPGDFRLKKLVGPLEQAGAKAPVFARVAQATQAVVDSNDKTASAALLDLATLVHAILYTQGETGATGEMSAIESAELAVQSTQTSARVLKPLMDALTTTGSGRTELVREAIDRGAFADLRLVNPALHALDDPYPEMGELIAAKVLPMYGKAVVPALRRGLNIKGRGGNLHRLRLLHAMDAEGTKETVKRVLDEGSKEMRVVAIECLSTSGSDLVFLLEQTKAKAQDVRTAALKALAGATAATPEIVGALTKAVDGADLTLCVAFIHGCTIPAVKDHVLKRANEQLSTTLSSKTPKEQGEAMARLTALAQCLRERTDAGAEAFLLACLEATPAFVKIKSTPSGLDFLESLSRLLSHGTAKTRERFLQARAKLPDEMLREVFDAAMRTLPPTTFYAEYRSVLRAGVKKGPDRVRAEMLCDVILVACERRTPVYATAADKTPVVAMDPRWVDDAIEFDRLELVLALARRGQSSTHAYLTAKLAAAKGHDEFSILQCMADIGHPGATDAVIAMLQKRAKTAMTYWGYWYRPLIIALPKSAAPRLEEVLKTLPEKLVDDLLESILELKNKEE
jgi:hypothetical protein